MPNYQNGKIYKVTCLTSNKCYIGSTTSTLKRRLWNHTSEYKRKRLYYSIFEIFDGCNWKEELLENYPCDSRYELEERERYWIENTKNAVNKIIPTRTGKETREIRKEADLKRIKEWTNANKEKVEGYKKKHYENNKEKLKKRAKISYEKNKEKQLKTQKELRTWRATWGSQQIKYNNNLLAISTDIFK